MGLGEHIAERQPHGFEIGTRAVDHDDRRHGAIARTDIDHVQGCPDDIDHLSLRGIDALQDNDTGLSDQRENDQRRHDNDRYHVQCPDHLGHDRITALRRRGFAASQVFPVSHPSGARLHTAVISTFL